MYFPCKKEVYYNQRPKGYLFFSTLGPWPPTLTLGPQPPNFLPPQKIYILFFIIFRLRWSQYSIKQQGYGRISKTCWLQTLIIMKSSISIFLETVRNFCLNIKIFENIFKRLIFESEDEEL